MHYRQIVENHDPLNLWTFERYSGDLQNVFDEETNHTLLNNNTTLGESGQVNQNFSGRSANLKGGDLIVADGNYLDTQIANRTFNISFVFKTDGTEITGLKPLVSKWEPDQQFFIGFENGNLTAKIQTTSGLVECTIDNKYVIYNNYWNNVVVKITSTAIKMWLNGISVETTMTGAINASTLSQFRIGSPAPNPFTTDVWINDVAVWETWQDHVPLIMYRMTRSDKDCWLGQAPIYFYDLPFWWNVDKYKPIPNEGYGGEAYAYIVCPNGNEPSLHQPTTVHDKINLELPAYSWVTIDTDLDFNWTDGFTFAVYGEWDYPYRYQYSTSNRHWDLVHFDAKANNTDNTWRYRLAAMAADRSSVHTLGYEAYDETGTLLGSQGPNSNQDYNSHTPGWGLNYHRIHQTQAQDRIYSYNYWANRRTTSRGTAAYHPTVPLAWNRLCYNSGANQSVYYRIAEMAFFEYLMSDEMADFLMYPRPMLMSHYLHNRYGPRCWWGASINWTDPQWRDYRNGSEYDMTSAGHSVTYTGALPDPLSNRQNYFPSSAWFSSTGWTGQNYDEDGNDMQTYDLTFNFFIWNRNTERRYEILVNHYSTSYPRETPAGYKLSIGVNSSGRLYEQDTLEFTTKDYEVAHTVELKNALPDDGFHMVSCIRRGYVMEIWIDAVLRAKIVTPTIESFGGGNRPLLIAGDNCYLYEWWFQRYTQNTNPWNQRTLEFIFQGYADVVKGQTLLSGSPLPSKLFAIRHDNGEVITGDATDDQGKFEFTLPKSVNHQAVDIVALPQDETATNHVVVHGPYSANTVYSRYVEEVFDQSLKDIFLDMEPERYYPMDDIVGTTVPDASGNGHDGTIIGGNYTIGNEAMEKDSKSIYLDGIDAYIDLPDGFDNLSEFTFSAWVRETATLSYARVFDMSTAPSGANGDAIYMQRISTNQDLRAGFNGNAASVDGVGAIDNYAWAHYVWRFKADGTGELWVNGVLFDSENQGLTMLQNVRTDCYIGKSSYPDPLFKGYFSHFAFYDYAIPIEEIKKQSYRGFATNLETLRSRIESDNPVAYWTFDRLKGLVDEVQDYAMTATGTYGISKNALTLNAGVIGNNYLQNSDIKVGDAGGNKWSVECLVKTATTNTDGVVVSEWNQASSDGVFKLCLDSGNFFRLYIGSEASFIQSSIQYNDDKFHHVVVTYDGTTVKLYVDNSFEASANTTFNYGAGLDFTVGNTSDGDASWHLEGETHIDDVAIYDYDLELQQIENHYNLFLEKKDTL